MTHVHKWGEIELGRLTGEPHRKCLTCRVITLDLYEEEPMTEHDANLVNAALASINEAVDSLADTDDPVLLPLYDKAVALRNDVEGSL